MRATIARVALVGALSIGTAALAGCSTSRITAARLDAAVGPAFTRLYAHQQDQLGNAGHRTPDGHADCRRNSTTSRSRGAGDDWVCVVNYPYPDGHVEPLSYDVQVQPTGCYTAAGPSQVVGPQRQRDVHGSTITNPLFEFDGCLDVS